MCHRPHVDETVEGNLFVSDGLVSLAEPVSASEDFSCKRICDHYRQEAQRIQTLLLPMRAPQHEAVEIAFRFTPFSEVGGDFADFFALPDGLIGLYMGDVVGKGLPAAMYGALVMGTLRGIHKTGTDTARVLSLLNERLAQRPIQGRFCSTLYALFNPATHELRFSNAGIPLPLLVSGNTCRALGEGGLPSGLFPGAAYGAHVVRLAPGDSVLFATDGLHEWRNREGIEFGDEQIGEIWLQCQSKSAGESIDHMFESIHEFSQGGGAHDDTTAVVLRVRE
jgi:sigma-B regulation protein RsbU (phosphoserine phosphatase)